MAILGRGTTNDSLCGFPAEEGELKVNESDEGCYPDDRQVYLVAGGTDVHLLVNVPENV